MMESLHNRVALQVVATGSDIESSFIGSRQALENSAELRS
jgi:hypothetical protein